MDSGKAGEQPNGVLFGHAQYRIGVLTAADTIVSRWVTKEALKEGKFADASQNQVASMIGQHCAMISKWSNGLRIDMNNILLLEIAFAIVNTSRISESLESEQLIIPDGEHPARMPSFDWYVLAQSGYLHVKRVMNSICQMDMKEREFWWLFHLFADRRWLSAEVKSRTTEKEKGHEAAQKCLVDKAVYVRRSMGLKPNEDVGDYEEVSGYTTKWMKLWFVGTPDSSREAPGE